jgi:hypothetical protein
MEITGEIFPHTQSPTSLIGSTRAPWRRIGGRPDRAAPHCRGWPLPCAPVARYPRLPVELSARFAVATPVVPE